MYRTVVLSLNGVFLCVGVDACVVCVCVCVCLSACMCMCAFDCVCKWQRETETTPLFHTTTKYKQTNLFMCHSSWNHTFIPHNNKVQANKPLHVSQQLKPHLYSTQQQNTSKQTSSCVTAKAAGEWGSPATAGEPPSPPGHPEPWWPAAGPGQGAAGRQRLRLGRPGSTPPAGDWQLLFRWCARQIARLTVVVESGSDSGLAVCWCFCTVSLFILLQRLCSESVYIGHKCRSVKGLMKTSIYGWHSVVRILILLFMNGKAVLNYADWWNLTHKQLWRLLCYTSVGTHDLMTSLAHEILNWLQ